MKYRADLNSKKQILASVASLPYALQKENQPSEKEQYLQEKRIEYINTTGNGSTEGVNNNGIAGKKRNARDVKLELPSVAQNSCKFDESHMQSQLISDIYRGGKGTRTTNVNLNPAGEGTQH